MKKNYLKLLVSSLLACSMTLICLDGMEVQANTGNSNKLEFNKNNVLFNEEANPTSNERPYYGFENIGGNWYYYDVNTGVLQTGLISVPANGGGVSLVLCRC